LANLKIEPTIPWCLPAIALLLWLMWLYLGGRGWPHRNAGYRKQLLRANLVSWHSFGWSLVAGILAIAALAGYWIISFQLFRMAPNLILPQRFASSPVFIGAIILGASLVAPITEESAVRGYLQSVLEREFSPITAIAFSSLIFALAHVSQGVAIPKLFVYFLVGIVFGSLAFVNNSILPVIPVHILADLTFFLFIWPKDGMRELIWHHPADIWFWFHVIQAVGFTLLFIFT